jgi:EAL domain-containing protein (putative c-di-GMP-specific phosphodiesterase class I)
VVAEGVETEAELTAVTELGCDYYQGYLLGRPVPAEFLRFRSPLQALQHNGSR